MAGQLWVRLMRKNKMVRDTVAHCPQGEDWRAALTAACHQMDLPVPVQVPKHERDWAEYRQTRFLPEHFMEAVSFDRMEIEFFDPDSGAAARRSQDPRNG